MGNDNNIRQPKWQGARQGYPITRGCSSIGQLSDKVHLLPDECHPIIRQGQNMTRLSDTWQGHPTPCQSPMIPDKVLHDTWQGHNDTRQGPLNDMKGQPLADKAPMLTNKSVLLHNQPPPPQPSPVKGLPSVTWHYLPHPPYTYLRKAPRVTWRGHYRSFDKATLASVTWHGCSTPLDKAILYYSTWHGRSAPLGKSSLCYLTRPPSAAGQGHPPLIDKASLC
jgi:hypothetical protein